MQSTKMSQSLSTSENLVAVWFDLCFLRLDTQPKELDDVD